MDKHFFEINGNIVPEKIVKRIHNREWNLPINKANLLELIIKKSPFGNEEKLLKGMINGFCLYDIALMEKESKGFIKWRDYGERILFHGKKDGKTDPGEIDPERLILFADFGIGNDTPFGLDYQDDGENPTVVLLYYGSDPYKDNRWIKLTASF